MLRLSEAQTRELVSELNMPERVQEFRELLTGELRDEWVAGEDEPRDTSSSELRRTHLEFADHLIAEIAQRKGSTLHPLIKASDFYFYTGERAVRPAYGMQRVALPVCAYRILQTVFNFDSHTGTWSHRPWLGSGRDILIHLPYSRKYDRERAEMDERHERRWWEAIERAYDLVCLFASRCADVALDEWTENYRLPELADIQQALRQDHLTLRVDDLGALFAGSIRFELVRLNEFDVLKPARDARLIYPPLATGSYQGVLEQVRIMRPASVKKIVLNALEALSEDIFCLTHPLDDEASELLRDQVEQAAENLAVR